MTDTADALKGATITGTFTFTIGDVVFPGPAPAPEPSPPPVEEGDMDPEALFAALFGGAVTVSAANQQEFEAALNAMTGPTKISLAPGDYGWWGHWRNAHPVWVVSEESAGAVFSAALVNGCNGVVFDDCHFKDTYSPGDVQWKRRVSVEHGSTMVRFVNCFHEGNLRTDGDATEAGYPFGFGTWVRGASHVYFEGCEFTTYFSAIEIAQTDTALVRNCLFRGNRADGIKIGGAVTNMDIEDCYIGPFARSVNSGDHPDCIQLHSNGPGLVNENIRIRRCVFDTGAYKMQCLHFGNEYAKNNPALGPDVYTRNILFEDCEWHTHHLNALLFFYADGLTMRRCKVTRTQVQEPGQTADYPVFRAFGDNRNIHIEDCEVYGIDDGSGTADTNPEWTLINNTILPRT